MQRLVLVGGGPNHYEIIKYIAEKSPKDRQILLVSPHRRVFDDQYLPKHLMKLLSRSQCELDLWKASQRAGVEFIVDQVVRLDKTNRLLELEKNGHLPFDMLSVECLSQSVYPRMNGGSQAYILPSKPYEEFLTRFQDFLGEVKKHSPRDVRVALSGSSLAAIELGLAVHYRLRSLCQRSELVVFCEDSETLFDVTRGQRKGLVKMLKKQGIRFLTDKVLEQVDQHTLYFSDKSQLEVDIFIPSEKFRPQSLFTRLLSSKNQKIYVNPNLQLDSDENIYIHGDCVQLFTGQEEFQLTDKVEQVDVLKKNLFRSSEEIPFVRYRVVPRKLKELPISDQQAVRFIGPFAQIKTWDRVQWQRETTGHLQQKKQVPLNKNYETQATRLEKFEAGHARRPWESSRVLNSQEQAGRLQLVSTMGYNWWGDYGTSSRYLTELVLAKSLCQGLIPESLRLSLVIPEDDPQWSQFLFQSSIKAVENCLEQEGVFFAGGDTLTGNYWSLALTIAGQQMAGNRRRFRSGDFILITRPLGFGLLWSGRRQDQFASDWFEGAVNYPVCPGIEPIVKFFDHYSISAAVTVEEWGFLYHCMQAVPVDQQLVVNFREIPKWTGVDEVLCEKLNVPSVESNWQRIAREVNFDRDRVSKSNTILWDSRSHGSMVLGVRPENWREALDSLQKMGFTEARVIGCIRPKKTEKKVVLSDWIAKSL